jgi:prepilin-type N-terminal cleavage/methylation domain-containing protein
MRHSNGLFEKLNLAVENRSRPVRGFSLIEMMVVMAVILVIMGTVFKSIAVTEQTSASQQVKVDLTQETREFIDQLTRDLRSTGYPNTRNVSQTATDPNNPAGGCPDLSTNILTSPCDPSNGVGLIYLNFNQLWFAGDVDGTSALDVNNQPDGVANVKIIKYDYFPAGAGVNCPCLRRSEYLRTAYQDPFQDANTAPPAQDQLEIQGVQNGATAADPIFQAFDPSTGAAVAPPIDFTNGANTMATINSLQIVLEVQSAYKDSTGAFPVTRVSSSIALGNCSEAWGGTRKTFSC